MNTTYKYETSVAMMPGFPCVIGDAELRFADGSTRRLKFDYSGRSPWGGVQKLVNCGKSSISPMPAGMKVTWLSLTERRAYRLEHEFDTEQLEQMIQQKDDDGQPLFKYVAVGVAPFGGVAVWMRGFLREVLVCWLKGEECDASHPDVQRMAPIDDVGTFCDYYLRQMKRAAPGITVLPLPAANHFDRVMQQYRYRFRPIEEYWNGQNWQEYDKEDLYYDDTYIECVMDKRIDGTHDKTTDYKCQRCTRVAGLPECIAVKWMIEHKDYSSYYWLDSAQLMPLFEQFFKLDFTGRADFVFRIDVRAQKYALAIDCAGMQHKVAVPQTAYQQIVFCDGNEIYRSPNYAQEDGAWIW